MTLTYSYSNGHEASGVPLAEHALSAAEKALRGVNHYDAFMAHWARLDGEKYDVFLADKWERALRAFDLAMGPYESFSLEVIS